MNKASDSIAGHVSSAELAIALKAEPPQRLQTLERAFWNWLATPDVPPVKLLELVRTGRLQVSDQSGQGTGQKTLSSPYLDGELYDWILQCLPADENPAQPLFRRVLAGRVGQVFALIASEHSVRSSLRSRDWTSLFDFAHGVCVPDALAAGAMRLQAAFDADGKLPYPPDSERAQNFIRLLARVQPDNSLVDRWLAALSAEPGAEEQANPAMPASLTEAWNGFCRLPQAIALGVVEDAVGRLCRGIEKRYSSDAVRRTEAERYIGFICTSKENERFCKLAIAGLWRQHKWLPTPNSLMYVLANVRDLAFLGGALKRLTTSDSPFGSLAQMIYFARSSKLLPNRGNESLKHSGDITNPTSSDKMTQSLLRFACQQDPNTRTDIELLSMQQQSASFAHLS